MRRKIRQNAKRFLLLLGLSSWRFGRGFFLHHFLENLFFVPSPKSLNSFIHSFNSRLTRKMFHAWCSHLPNWYSGQDCKDWGFFSGETTSVIEDIPKCNEEISLATYEQSFKYKSLEFSSVEILPSLGLHNLFSKLFE